MIIGLDSFRFEIVQYNKVIPEQFTVKAQQPLLGVKKRRSRGEGGGGAKIFSSGNLMSCPELYSQVKSDNKFVFLQEF